MIAKQIKGSSFYGVLKYMDDKVKKDVGKLLHTNMYGQKPVELNKEFELVRSLRPTLKKVVYHASLNLSPGENLTDIQFLDIANRYLNDMGFDNNQFIVYRHYDREHSHIHIIANRVKYDGEVVSDSQDYKRSELIIRSIEKDYCLQQVEESQKSERKALSKGMVEYARKTGEAPLKLQLQEIIDKAIEGKPNIDEFEKKLIENGVGTRFYTNSKGLYGMSFTIDGFSFKASSLGKKYQFKNFKNLIDYDNKRDIKTISQKSY